MRCCRVLCYCSSTAVRGSPAARDCFVEKKEQIVERPRSASLKDRPKASQSTQELWPSFNLQFETVLTLSVLNSHYTLLLNLSSFSGFFLLIKPISTIPGVSMFYVTWYRVGHHWNRTEGSINPVTVWWIVLHIKHFCLCVYTFPVHSGLVLWYL